MSTDNNSKRKSYMKSFVLTLVFVVTGFAMLHFGLVAYGLAFFVLLPVLIGFSIGALPNRDWSVFGLISCLIATVIGLILLGLEGAICGLFVLGLLLPIAFIAAIISHSLKANKDANNKSNLKVLVAPLLIFVLIAPLEEKSISINEVKTDIILPYTPEQVYDEIKSVDTLNVEKSPLMYLGLPVPHKCILDSEAVGANRTCYFDGGKILEKTTEIERGRILRMIVTDYQLTGRKWLGFKDAVYLFEKTSDGQTKMTRITTYTSELLPRFYWEPLERLGIEQEHDYVFRNLQKDLKDKHQN